MKALSILSVSHFSLGGWWLYESLESLCKHTQWALININWAQRDPQLSGARWSAHFLLDILSHPLFQQHKRRLYTWTSPDGQHQNQIDYILCSQIWRSSILSAKKQDQELTEAQIMNTLLPNFRLKLKKVGKTTRPFRYDLNQIPYDYTVEVKIDLRD